MGSKLPRSSVYEENFILHMQNTLPVTKTKANAWKFLLSKWSLKLNFQKLPNMVVYDNSNNDYIDHIFNWFYFLGALLLKI